MKLAVTDACIFIELYNLRLTSEFFKLDIEVHTSIDVFNELYDEQQDLLLAYQDNGKLRMHSLTEEDRVVILKTKYSAGLSENDKTVLHIAVQNEALVLSSDKAVRKHAKKLSIEYHGMLWIFDRLVELSLVSKTDAVLKLKQMMTANIIYQNNMELLKEMHVRIVKWES
jgi:predicted nucleic acid-binding protein